MRKIAVLFDGCEIISFSRHLFLKISSVVCVSGDEIETSAFVARFFCAFFAHIQLLFTLSERADVRKSKKKRQQTVTL